MGETRIVFAEMTLLFLQQDPYRYMEDYIYKHAHGFNHNVKCETCMSLLDRLGTEESQELRLFAHFVRQTSIRIWKTQILHCR